MREHNASCRAALAGCHSRSEKRNGIHRALRCQVLEGSRFYKVNGSYYIFTDHPPDGEYVLSPPLGPLVRIRSASLWSALSHRFQMPARRIRAASSKPSAVTGTTWPSSTPTLVAASGPAPLKWDTDGWPVLEIKDNTWGVLYPNPLASNPLKPLTGTDRFRGSALNPQWEWNHNPDNTKSSADHGLTLNTTTVTDDVYQTKHPHAPHPRT
jgi:hypothetical protein